MKKYKISSFYKFVNINSPEILRDKFISFFKKRSILGTVILSNEGINGMLAGRENDLDKIIDFIIKNLDLNYNDFKFSLSIRKPFNRLRIKIKDEIISLGDAKNSNPNKFVGKYLDHSEWNTLLEDDDVVLIDTRNYYETSIGTFKNSLIPDIDNFKEFPNFVEKLKPYKNKKIAMFCTGGIRCEKASSFMLQNGFKNVFHLKGGIISYLEKTNPDNSKWKGECFVFDNRVAIKQDLSVGNYLMCYACNEPVSFDEINSDKYKEGIHCPKCFDKLTSKQIERLSERQKQIELARKRGKLHLGE